MKKKFAPPGLLTAFASLAALAASLTLAHTSLAVGYTEMGDAGDLPSSAQTVFGATGTSLTSLSGALTLTNGTSDSDLFQIYISNPSTFSASLTAFIPGSNNFDSQLALFTLAGLGVEAGDDDPATGSPQSNLPAGNTLLSSRPAGLYYLLISGSGRYPVSAGGLIFPNFTDGTTDPTVIQGPTGPGGAAAISGYTGSSNEAGNYVIALTGAQFVTPVPEPGTSVLLLAGLAGLGVAVQRRRRTLAK